jgi:hypothetical protein
MEFFFGDNENDKVFCSSSYKNEVKNNTDIKKKRTIQNQGLISCVIHSFFFVNDVCNVFLFSLGLCVKVVDNTKLHIIFARIIKSHNDGQQGKRRKTQKKELNVVISSF